MDTTPGMLTAPEVCREIAGVADAVPRNLQITQSYHDLSSAMHRWLGGRDANWCTFATWASKQAGAFIRNDEVPRGLRELLGIEAGGAGPATPAHRSWLLGFVVATVEDVSRHIADGNRKVYAELGPIFARFLQAFGDDLGDAGRTIDDFCATLKPGDTADGGQERLRRAFRYYHAARSVEDAKQRAEQILLANLLVGQHEQIRLQSAIAGSLDAPFDVALERAERRAAALRLRDATRQLLRFVIRLVMPRALRDAKDLWIRAETEFMMTLALPDGTLHLGDDLPPLPDGRSFPPELEQIRNSDLTAFLADIRAARGPASGSGADNWADLDDRMVFIAALFRSRQQDERLLQQPFAPDQAAVIRDGGVPEGKLQV